MLVMIRFPFLRAAVAAVGVALSGSVVGHADDHRDNAEMLRLLRPVAQSVADSVVQVLCGGRPVSLGTVVAADGYVLTKRSELTSDPIRVRLSDGRMFPASIAAVRRQNDLAMLRVDSEESLTPVQFASEAPSIASFLVTPGRTGRPIGIGVVGVKERAVGHQGRLGVMLEDDSSGRALVQMVWPDSGAELAGVEPDDRIIAINGREEKNRSAVIETLRGMFPGESVRLTILRPNELGELEQIEMDASIRDMGVLQESESDSRVNGPRNIRLSGFDRVIQHDTVLDPDECGGPVLDTAGRVIGMNIARAGRVVSYSLPSSLILPEMVSMLEEARGSR
jgi:S1-C subfamily serine protease